MLYGVGGGGPVGTLVDPLFEEGDLGVCQLVAYGGHGFPFRAPDHGDDFAGLGVAGKDDALGGIVEVEPEVGGLELWTVAGDAALLEDGLDLADEVDFGRSLGLEAGECQKERGEKLPSAHGRFYSIVVCVECWGGAACAAWPARRAVSKLG